MFLEWCADLPAAVWQQHAPPLWSVLLALAGVAWLLAPRGLPWRATGLALMLPAIALPPPAPAPGEAWITTLDVGQGLAVLVRTANRALLYDAGPAFGADADSGERIIAPYLRATGIERLDAMVVTHNDTDHSGGAASVVGNFEVDALLHSLPLGPSAARHGGRRAALRGRHVLGVGRRALRGAAPGGRRGAREEEQRPELRAESDRAAGARCCSPATSSGRRKRNWSLAMPRSSNLTCC